jgi:DNA-binding SARP family transcriptional activator
VNDDEGPVKVTGKLRRTLLAALLLDAGTPVSADRLAALLWGPDASRGTAAALHTQLMRLRQALGGEDRVRAVPPGYLIDLEPGELDLRVFAEECAAARRELADRRWAEASRRFGAALGLWRGRPLADLPALAGDLRVRELEETRLQALQGRIEAELNLGRHHEVLGELRALVREHPRNEAFRGQLMLALHRAGLGDDAAAGYDEYREALLDELGLEPGADLRALHEAVLRGDAALSLPPNPNAPRQLPADTRTFTGRAAELAQLVAAAADAAGTLVISALDGMGGVGKTALAVRAAHRVADRFRDGQLFIDLRGYSTGGAAMPAEDALAYLLRSLGVAAPALPDGVEERAELYRARLAGSRTLILLDNAADPEQVRPLLPGAPGCLVLITSRDRLARLRDARALSVDVLGEAEAVELLAKVAGPRRGLASHPAVRELAALCGYLPLALRIIAAQLRHTADLSVEDVLAELSDEDARLNRLTDGERDLTSVFETSFANLPGPEQRALRLLGLLPGPDIDPYAAANLLGTDIRTAEHLLNSLLDRSLLIQQVENRYGIHDLVRAYARTLSTPETAEDRAARDRLLDYYQHMTWAASSHYAGAVRWHTPTAPPGPVPDVPDLPGALVWLRRERACLMAALEHPACAPERRVDLTSALGTLLHQDGPWSQATALHEAAERTARELGDQLAQADALRNLAQIIVWSAQRGSDRPALVLEQAVELYRRAGNRSGEADTLLRYSQVLRERDEPDRALAVCGQSLALFRGLGDRLGEAMALKELAEMERLRGRFDEAREHARTSGDLFRDTGYPQAEVACRTTLGYLEIMLGELVAAAENFALNLAVARREGMPQTEAVALGALGHIHSMQGARERAETELTESLEIYQRLGYEFGTAYTLTWHGQALACAGEPTAAIAVLERARGIVLTGSSAGNRNNIVRELGWARHLAGDPEGRALIEQSLEFARETRPDEPSEIDAMVYLGRVLEDDGDPAAAAELFEQIVARTRRTPRAFAEAFALDGRSRCLAALGEREAARESLRAAVPIYRRLGLAELAEAERRLAELDAWPERVATPSRH